MTEPVTLSRRTWATVERDDGDRHGFPVHVTWTETIVLRDTTDEERQAIREALK